MVGNDNDPKTASQIPAKADADAQDGFSNDSPSTAIPAGATGKRAGSAGKKPTPSPDTKKTSGAGPAIAEHSKDAKAPKAGRQPGAYVKD